MRLIDAHDVLGRIEMMETANVVDVVENIILSPTIEAVPVSWIIQWSAEHMNEYGTVTIAKMLEDWRKYENNRESAGDRRETIKERK